ncbi:YIP1 family protein [Haloparvum sedimenti]|uniref:YIP1 family protein n=1 Tax=Haloparvum sedimenti TaxID=1678448 RepID=UPI00071E72FC|nr:YIP1 family protein [Haloparvum sedimenti]
MPSTFARLRAALGRAATAPNRFFDRRSPSLGTAFLVVLAVGVGVSLGIVTLGAVFDATIDATVTVENPDRPPEWVCEQHGTDGVHDTDDPFASGCDEPEYIDVDAGSELRDAVGGYVHYGFLGVLLWWVFSAGVFHAAARFAGGSARFGASLTAAAWALVPELLRMAAALALIYAALRSATVTGAGMEALADDVLAAFGTVEPWILVVSLVTVSLEWWLFAAAGESFHDLPRSSAVAAAAVPAGFSLIAALI